MKALRGVLAFLVVPVGVFFAWQGMERGAWLAVLIGLWVAAAGLRRTWASMRSVAR